MKKQLIWIVLAYITLGTSSLIEATPEKTLSDLQDNYEQTSVFQADYTKHTELTQSNGEYKGKGTIINQGINTRIDITSPYNQTDITSWTHHYQKARNGSERMTTINASARMNRFLNEIIPNKAFIVTYFDVEKKSSYFGPVVLTLNTKPPFQSSFSKIELILDGAGKIIKEIKLYDPSKQLMADITISYTKVDGLKIKEKVKIKQYYQGKIVQKSTIAYSNIIIDPPIPEGTFTLPKPL